VRGLTISAHGGLDQLVYRTDLPKPEPKRGEIRVRVKAAALNHLDLFVIAGMPGVVPAVNARSIPRDKPVEQAAAFTLATLTAWRMVVTRARVKKGDNVLIWGIGGGVALAALEIVRSIGATAWVTSHSDEKLALARGLGAENLLNYATTDVGKEIRARTGKRGVDVVLDTVGEATWPQSLGALGKRGRLVTCGATSGPMVQMDVRRLFWNQWDIMGSTMGNDAEFDAITKEYRAGHFTPLVDSVFDISQGRQAFERLQSGQQFGKIVVRIPE